MAAAWVIEWMSFGANRSLRQNPVYILPYRWGGNRVMSVMQSIYYNNTEIFLGRSALFYMNRSEFNQGSEMRIGNNPYLIASYVKDLEFIVAEDGMSEILTWTRAANWKPNTDGVMECQGAEVKREVKRIIGSNEP